MKFTIFSLVCLFAVCRGVTFSALIANAEWESFKAMHNKKYSGQEETFRQKIFMESKLRVIEHNKLYEAELKSYALGINEYSDMLPHEFADIMLCLNREYKSENKLRRTSTYLSPANALVPDSVDWRTKGCVTPVKYQGSCGSCWAFSTTGSLEGQHFRKTGNLVSLSEQNLVACSMKYGNSGCSGGFMDNAFRYIKDNGGIDTEDSYPYEMQNGTCRFKKSNIGAAVSGIVDVPNGDEEKLKEAVGTIGPVSVAIDSSGDFYSYSGGVYYDPDCNSTKLNHAVLVVGYGTDSKGGDYWLVKNSWGKDWGDQGYIKMSRNRNNNCGIATAASYPLV